MSKYLFLFLIAISCKQSQNYFETKDWFEANLTLSSRKLFKSEELQVRVNGEVIYSICGDTSQNSIYKFFKISKAISKIEVTSKYNGKIILNKAFVSTYKTKRYQIVIGAPYPKDLVTLPFPYKVDWFQLPINLIKRDVLIRPDTSKNNIIL